MKQTRKIEQLLKSYFYFNKQERKGIVTLLIILILVILFPRVYTALYASSSLEYNIQDFSTFSNDSSIDINKQSSLFPFNPNTATDEELNRLGFTNKNIQTLHHFKNAGGQFHQPQDLQKVFGLNKKLIQDLIPFVQISSKKSLFPKDSLVKKTKLNYPIELNQADSETIVALYRIGPALTHKIIDYRKRLGGFLFLEQLKEIWGFDEDILYDLKDKIVVNPRFAKRFNMNTVSVDELREHPYFKYKLSNAIINYRMQHGSYQSLEDLKKIVIMNDSIYRKAILYLYVQP